MAPGSFPDMATRWTVTVDCAVPAVVARFWAAAPGYESQYPLDDADDGAFLFDPEGIGPNLSFLQVPEEKVAKNRLHLDIQGGRWAGRAVGRAVAPGRRRR